MQEDGEVWRCTVDLHSISAAVPESTRDLIAFRLEQLPTVDLCRLWRTTGKLDEARRRLSEALGTFDEGFAETDLHEARALLDELAAR